ncbi:hypothetical protein FIBSPDRAFT_869725, partial [Athelia psychrophila]
QDRSHFLQGSSSKNLHGSDLNGPRTAPPPARLSHTQDRSHFLQSSSSKNLHGSDLESPV